MADVLTSSIEWLLFSTVVAVLYASTGYVFSQYIPTPKYFSLPLSLVLGVVLVTLSSYFFGFLGLRDLSLGIWLTVGLVQIIRTLRSVKKSSVFPRLSALWGHSDFISLLIVAIGILMQLTSTWNFGVERDGRVTFCCRGTYDLIYHAALSQEASEKLPPDEPGISGVVVTNYHYLSNVVIGDLARITHLPTTQLIGQMTPLLVLVLLAWGAWAIGHELNFSLAARRWLLLCIFFFGEVSILTHFLATGSLNTSLSMVDDALKLTAGPPRAFSIAIAFWSLYLVLLHFKKPKFLLALLCALAIGSLAGFKMYTYLLMAGGLAGMTLQAVYRRNWTFLMLPILAAGAGVAVYLAANSASSNGLVFHAPYIVYNFIEHPDLGLSFLELRLQVFEAYNNIPKIILYQVGFIGIYLLTVLGLSVVGFGSVLSAKNRKVSPFLYGVLFVGLTLGLFSSQEVGGLNTVQFIMTLPYFLSIGAAVLLAEGTKKIKQPLIAYGSTTLLVLLLSIQTLLQFAGNLRMLSEVSSVDIPSDELEMIECLKELPNDGLLAIDPSRALRQPSLHVPLLTHKKMYLAGVTSVLVDHGITQGVERYERYLDWYTNANISLILADFYENNVKYLYIPVTDLTELERAHGARVLCSNDTWKVLRLMPRETQANEAE